MAMALRILLVHERFAPDYGGGGEYVVHQIALQVRALGHHVRVLTTGDPSLSGVDGLAVERLPMSRRRFAFAWRSVAARAENVDVIHAFSNYAARPAALAGRALGKPVVLGILALFDRVWRETHGPVVGRLFETFEHHMLRLPVACRIFLSPESMALVKTLRLSRPNDTVIAPGISLEDYRPASVKTGVVFSGKLDPRKGIETVSKLARALPDIPFTAVVWGDDFERFAATAAPNLTVLRFRDRLQLARVLASARIFLFPSRAETFGLAVAEAMASGCAVVGNAPIEFEGLRVDPLDFESNRRALIALWADGERCAEAGRRNVARAQAFSWHRHGVQLDAVYRGVLGLGPAPETPSIDQLDCTA